MKLILGSSSKFRQQVLREMGYDFEVISPDIDEKAIRHEDSTTLVLALANAKADALLEKITEPAIIITADQVVVSEGKIREKPVDAAEARHFLKTCSDHPSQTISAVVALNTKTGQRAKGVDVVTTHYSPLPEAVIDQLVAEGEVFYCAGAIRQEDSLMKPYIASMDGTLDSVMGLPAALTKNLIDQVKGEE